MPTSPAPKGGKASFVHSHSCCKSSAKCLVAHVECLLNNTSHAHKQLHRKDCSYFRWDQVAMTHSDTQKCTLDPLQEIKIRFHLVSAFNASAWALLPPPATTMAHTIVALAKTNSFPMNGKNSNTIFNWSSYHIPSSCLIDLYSIGTNPEIQQNILNHK